MFAVTMWENQSTQLLSDDLQLSFDILLCRKRTFKDMINPRSKGWQKMENKLRKGLKLYLTAVPSK